MIDALLADLRRDEGWRPFVYKDHLGFDTIGYGFLVDPRKGVGLPQEIGNQWLEFALETRWNQLLARAPWILEQPEDVQRALGNMVYQLGVDGLLAFVNTLALIKQGDRTLAANEALKSKWATQTPERANRVARLIRGY